MNNWLKRNKNTAYLLALLLLLPLFTYSFALSNYFRLRREVKQQETEIVALRQQDPLKTDEIQASTDLLFSGELIDRLNNVVAQRNLKILHYTPRISVSEKTGALYTAEATISGNYLQVTRLIDYIETSFKQCRIISVCYFIVSTGYKGSKELQCTIVIQQIVKTA